MPAAKKKTTATRRTKTPAKRSLQKIAMKRTGQMSPQLWDVFRAQSGWSQKDLSDSDGEPTGKGLAAHMWMSIYPFRPEITPQMIYECDDLEEAFGIELVALEPQDPTNAAS